jgi:hypothetical protein
LTPRRPARNHAPIRKQGTNQSPLDPPGASQIRQQEVRGRRTGNSSRMVFA